MLRELEEEKYILLESLHELQTSVQQDREWDQERYRQELEEEKNWIL